MNDREANQTAHAETLSLDDKLEQLNGLKYAEEIEELLEVMEQSPERTAETEFLLAQGHWRLDQLESAFSHFLKSAEAGHFAANYCAGRILRKNSDLINPTAVGEYDPMELNKRAADRGHIWACLVQARFDKGNSVYQHFYYYVYRFFIAPTAIIKIFMLDTDKEKIRY